MTTTAGHARPVFEPRDHHAPGTVNVPIPPRLRWWRQLRREQLCRRLLGHCWHPDQMITWECCECAAYRDGPGPVDRCRMCTSPSRRGIAAGAIAADAFVQGVEEGSTSPQRELSPMELYTRNGAIPTGRTAEILMEAERGWIRRQEAERARMQNREEMDGGQ